MARGPITWQNVNTNFGDPGTTMNNAFDRLQSVGDGMQGLLNERRAQAEEGRAVIGEARTAEMHPLDVAAQRVSNQQAQFDLGASPERLAMDRMRSEAYAQQVSGAPTPLEQVAADILNKHSVDGVMDEEAANAEASAAGVPRDIFNAEKDQYRAGSQHYRDIAKEQEYVDLSMKQQVKSRAANSKEARKRVEAPENIESGWFTGEYDTKTRNKWSDFYGKLRRAGASDAKAREVMEQGTNYGFFSDWWKKTPEQKDALLNLQNTDKAAADKLKKALGAPTSK